MKVEVRTQVKFFKKSDVQNTCDFADIGNLVLYSDGFGHRDSGM